MTSVRKRVINVVAQTLKVDAGQINDDSRFVEDLGAESMQSVELVAAFEEEFDIDLNEEDALDIKSVGRAVEFISGHIACA